MPSDETKRAFRDALLRFLASDSRDKLTGLPHNVNLPPLIPQNGSWYYIGNCENCNHPVPLVEEPFPHRPAASFGEISVITIACADCGHEQQHPTATMGRSIWPTIA